MMFISKEVKNYLSIYKDIINEYRLLVNLGLPYESGIFRVMKDCIVFFYNGVYNLSWDEYDNIIQ